MWSEWNLELDVLRYRDQTREFQVRVETGAVIKADFLATVEEVATDASELQWRYHLVHNF